MSSLPAWREEAATVSFRQALVGEFFASFFLLFMSVGTIVFSQDREGIAVESATQIAILCGITVSVLAYIFGPISGAHFNCCFSFMAALLGRITWFRCLCYSATQVLGMVAGTLYVKLLSPALFAKIDPSNKVQPGFSDAQALGMEVWVTLLVFLSCLACIDNRQGYTLEIAPLIVGTAVTTALFVGIPVSTACLNTSRALAVALVTGDFDGGRFWVFVFGPYLGALAVSLPYVLLFGRRPLLRDWLKGTVHVDSSWVSQLPTEEEKAGMEKKAAAEAKANALLAPFRDAMRQVDAAEGAMTAKGLKTAPSAFGLPHGASQHLQGPHQGHQYRHQHGDKLVASFTSVQSGNSFSSPLPTVADDNDEEEEDENNEGAKGQPSATVAHNPAADADEVRALSFRNSSFSFSLSPSDTPGSSSSSSFAAGAPAVWQQDGSRALVRPPSSAALGVAAVGEEAATDSQKPERSPW